MTDKTQPEPKPQTAVTDEPAIRPASSPRAAATTPTTRPGRHDEAYRKDQAAQRAAPTRFTGDRFRRKQNA